MVTQSCERQTRMDKVQREMKSGVSVSSMTALVKMMKVRRRA